MIIFKVQVSLFTTASEPRALVYNFERTIQGEFDADQALLDLMAGRPKAFFYGQPGKDGKLAIDQEAPWQDW